MNSYLLKVVLVGDCGVGKTSLLSQFVTKKFSESYRATIGSDFLMREVVVGSCAVTLQIWDTAGQEKWMALSSLFYRGTDICILVFDLTRNNSLKNLESWRQEFLDQNDSTEGDFPFIYVGNKADMKEERQISKHEAEQWSKDHGGIGYFETSAKTADNVEKLFFFAANEIIKRSQHLDDFVEKDQKSQSVVNLDKRKTSEESKCPCST